MIRSRTVIPIKRTRNLPENMFGMKRTKGINRFQDFTDSIARDVEILFPLLHEFGFGACHVRRDQVNERLKPTDMERFAKWNMRFMLDGSGKLVEIYALNDIHKRLVVQSQIIKSTLVECVKNYPVFNIPGVYAETHAHQPELIQLKHIQHTLYALDIYFLIITETGQFWLDRYSSIPQQEAYLTYKNEKTKRLDRIATKAGYQCGKFHSIQRNLVEELRSAIKYHNKNYKYESQ
jgi:hypothetical protein